MAYQLIRSYTYPEGETFQGKSVKGSFIFKTPAGVWGDSIANQMVSEFQSQMEDDGYKMLSYKMWGDYSGLITSQFYCEVVGYDPSEISGHIGGIGIPAALLAAMPLIIKAVVAIVVAILIYLSIKTVAYMDWPSVTPAIAWSAIAILGIAAAVAAVAYSPKRKRA